MDPTRSEDSKRLPKWARILDPETQMEYFTLRDFEEYFALRRRIEQDGVRPDPELDTVLKLRYFSMLAGAHKKIPHWLEEEIGIGFGEVLRGSTWEAAFPLAWTRIDTKPYCGSRAYRQMLIAHYYYFFRKPESFVGGDNEPTLRPTQAIKAVADRLCVSTKTVEAALTSERRRGNVLIWQVTTKSPTKKTKS